MILRPQQHLVTLGAKYPGAWPFLEGCRADRGRNGLPDWPDWCWLPMAAAYSFVSGGGEGRVPPALIHDVPGLSAAAAWRLSQGVYRYPADLFGELWDSPLDGDIPADLLMQMPEYCVYIECPSVPGSSWEGIHGWFAHLEWDANDGHRELRLLCDYEAMGLVPIPIHMDTGGLKEALASVSQEASRHLGRPVPVLGDSSIGEIRGMVSVLLHLCSAWSADARSPKGQVPTMPSPTRTKGRERWFPPGGPVVYETGYRLAEALRRVRNRPGGQGGGEGATGTSPSPHVRRAHWHGFWTGKKSDPAARKLEVRWMPPIPVGFRDAGLEDLIPTIRMVRGSRA